MKKIKNIHIFGGGTVAHIANHFAVCAPAYGGTARVLSELVEKRFSDTANISLELTKMAGGGWLETNEDITKLVEGLKADLNTKIIFFSCALVDWNPYYLDDINLDRTDGKHYRDFGKYFRRFETRNSHHLEIGFSKTNKVISGIRNGRKDIFLVGFKTTCGATKQEMYEKGLRLVKEGSCNLVLVNDTKTRWNMIVSPEESCLYESDDRNAVLKELVDITWYRSQLTFTQSTVVDGKPVPWNDERVPESLRQVVNHAIAANAL